MLTTSANLVYLSATSALTLCLVLSAKKTISKTARSVKTVQQGTTISNRTTRVTAMMSVETEGKSITNATMGT